MGEARQLLQLHGNCIENLGRVAYDFFCLLISLVDNVHGVSIAAAAWHALERNVGFAWATQDVFATYTD